MIIHIEHWNMSVKCVLGKIQRTRCDINKSLPPAASPTSVRQVKTRISGCFARLVVLPPLTATFWLKIQQIAPRKQLHSPPVA